MLDKSSMKVIIMKLRLVMAWLCALVCSVTVFAESDQLDFGYWRLRSGNYEYTIQRTVFSNSADCVGWCSSRVFALTINNETNRISVSFNDIISQSGDALGPKLKEALENESWQIKSITGSFAVGRNDNKLEVEKANNKFAQHFLGQMRILFAFPTPKKLVDGMIWTNSASLFSGVNNQSLIGRNGSNGQFIITSPSINECASAKQEKKSGFYLGEPYVLIDQRLDRIDLLSRTKTLEKVQSQNQTLKFISDLKKEPKSIMKERLKEAEGS